MTSTRTSIKKNEVRLYNSASINKSYFNVFIRNDWFSKEFVYKIHQDRIVFKRPTLEYINFPTKARKVANSWSFHLTLQDQDLTSLEILEEDVNEDQVVIYRTLID